MKQYKELKTFLYSQYFGDGVRITLGYIIPLLYFIVIGKLTEGSYASLGALLVGLSDTPGAPSHRKKGMFYALLLTNITYLLTATINPYLYGTTILIAVLCFVYAMFAVFNDRATNVGLMCILMMLTQINTHYNFEEMMHFALYFNIGGIWYIIVSLSFTQVRPYRLAQQELSESIRHVADYIRLRANFYDQNFDNEKNFLKLTQKQVEVHEHQEKTRELLFQSKKSIKDTTKIGRYLTLVFNDIVDLFEQSMLTQYDYDEIKARFGETGILTDFKTIILKLTNELDHLAYFLNANKKPKQLYRFSYDIKELQQKIDALDKSKYNNIPLRKILVNIRTMVRQIENIYSYSNLKPSDINKKEIDDAKQFVEKSAIDFKKFRENLTLDSTIFRHALRMAIVMSVTYLFASLVHISNNVYWILLTIMVILKPGFGLTKERNIHRLVGTIVGGLIGLLILILIKNQTILFSLLVFFFLMAYSLFRVSYITAVIFMTPYVLIMFSFISSNSFDVTKERIFDTFLGGMIAFLSSYIIFPNWESTRMRMSMLKLLSAEYNYIVFALNKLSGHNQSITEYKLTRKAVYVESANMGSTFQRMLTEPKNRQRFTKEANSFVILNHILTSYFATIITPIIEGDRQTLNILSLDDNINYVVADNKDVDGTLVEEQLNFLNKITHDIYKNVQDIVEKSIEEDKQKTLSK